MKNVQYRHVPSQNEMYKIQEACCHELVVYSPTNFGITERIDRNDEINGPLLCACYNDSTTVISMVEYEQTYKMVLDRLEKTT